MWYDYQWDSYPPKSNRSGGQQLEATVQPSKVYQSEEIGKCQPYKPSSG